MISVSTLLTKLLNVNKFVVFEAVEFLTDPLGQNFVQITGHLRKSLQWKCPYCGKKCSLYDSSKAPQHWRCLDFFLVPCFLALSLPRVYCPEHGVHVAGVPFAVPGSRHTKDFETSVAWHAKHMSKSAVSHLMRIDWKTVGRILHRVHMQLEPDISVRWNGLKRIGIDETSYRKGHKYITVIVNHDTGDVIWCGIGHGAKVLDQFFGQLTEEQRASIEVVTADGAGWIAEAVKKYLPQAVRCIDSFHVVEWALEALDKVRKAIYTEVKKKALSMSRDARNKKERSEARAMKKEAEILRTGKYPVGKNPENLTELQGEKLDYIVATHPKLERAYRLKEKLRLILHMNDVEEAKQELTRWISWARRCRIPVFVELQRKIRRHFDNILYTISNGLGNARIESTNNKIKLMIRRAFGFRDIECMIGMILLFCSHLPIELPGRPSHSPSC